MSAPLPFAQQKPCFLFGYFAKFEIFAIMGNGVYRK
jgi:hypothetical protein